MVKVLFVQGVVASCRLRGRRGYFSSIIATDLSHVSQTGLMGPHRAQKYSGGRSTVLGSLTLLLIT